MRYSGYGRGTAAFCTLLVALLAPAALDAANSNAAEIRTERYLDSIRKDPNLLLAFLREMPKGGDLHNHLSGSIYAETLIDWAAAHDDCVDPKTLYLSAPPCGLEKSTVPAKNALADPALYRSMVDAFSMRNWQLSGQSGHDHFFDSFDKFEVATHGNTGAMLAQTASRAASQGEVYQELMITPVGPELTAVLQKSPWNDNNDVVKMRETMLANGMSDAVAAAIKQIGNAETESKKELQCGTKKADPGCEVEQRYIFQVLRGLSKDVVFAQMVCGFEAAMADPRFVGVNLVMPEDYYTPMHDFSLHMQMLQYLHGVYPMVHITLHAGELVEGLVPPEGLSFHIRSSVETAHAERIGHGVDVMNETHALDLLKELAQRKVMVEVCLTSNASILGVQGPRHPLRDYIRAGVPVALATDDEGVSRSDMTHEYLRGVVDQELSYTQLKKMARTSLEHAFLPGDSLWADGTNFAVVKICVPDRSTQKTSPACQKLIDGSEKARLQWKLESQFREFEARPWPTPERPRATVQ